MRLQLGHCAAFPVSIAVLNERYGVMKIGEGNLCPQFKHFIVMLFVAASGAGSPDMTSPVDPRKRRARKSGFAAYNVAGNRPA